MFFLLYRLHFTLSNIFFNRNLIKVWKVLIREGTTPIFIPYLYHSKPFLMKKNEDDKLRELKDKAALITGATGKDTDADVISTQQELINDLLEYIDVAISGNSAGQQEKEFNGLSRFSVDGVYSDEILGSLSEAFIIYRYPGFEIDFVSPLLFKMLEGETSVQPARALFLKDLCIAEDQPVVEAFLRQFSEAKAASAEIRLTRNGKIRWIHCSVSPVNGHDGSVTQLNMLLSDVTDRKSFQDYSVRINEVLLGLGPDFQENINKLTALFGELFGATCALYNRLDEGLLCSLGQWQTPPGYNPADKPEGHICYDVIRGNKNEILLIRDLDKTAYAETDPNVRPYMLKTYIGQPVYCGGEAVGSLCAVFQSDFNPGEEHKNLINIIATAISTEESRNKAFRQTREAEERIQVLINATPDIICFKDHEGRWMLANDSILKLYCLGHVDYRGLTEFELAEFTADIYKDAFRNCGVSDEIAWEAGKLSRTEETIPDIYGVNHVFDVIKVPIFREDGSRKGLVVFGRDITQRSAGEKHTKFLNESALEFLELDDEVNIYEFIGEKIHKLAGRSLVMVTSFNEENQVATLQAVYGLGKVAEKVLGLLGRHPVGMSTPLTSERKQDVLYQKLTPRNDLFELLAGAVSKPLCRILETILDIGDILEMGFARREYLLGDVTIITPRNNSLSNVEVIEAFIKLAAVALHRRQASEDLRASEESYRGLFNSISSAVYIIDREGRFIDVNQGALDMYGYPKERFIGETPEFLSAPGKNDAIDNQEIIRRTFEGNHQTIEFWGIRHNGEVFPKEIRFYPGNYFGREAVVAIANDITEQYSMISQIVSAKEVAENNLLKINSIISAFPDSIFIFDRQSRLIESYSNQPDEILESYFSNLSKASGTDGITNGLAGIVGMNTALVLDSGKLQKFEFSLPEGGNRVFYEFTMVKRSHDQVLVVARNTTERMELLEALTNAKEKAEESDRLKTSFLHNISHEIRTPMNGIVGFTNLLTQPGVKESDKAEYSSIINSCSNQLLSIITDIVSIATLEAGQEKVRDSKTNINELMQIVFLQLNSKAVEKNLSLSFSCGLASYESEVTTDETKLNQIVSNLVNNAIKFTSKGSVSFGYSLENDFLKFWVEDTGAGIPAEMTEIIFERFRQLNSKTSGTSGGTGLGLSISKSYVELLGGKIWVESEPGSGSKFFFTIPYRPLFVQSAGLSVEKPEDPESLLAGSIVLIAEDEYFNYRLLIKMLQNFGLEFIYTDNGMDAVKICAENKNIDLVLMDMKMPGMDGFEATRKIRETNKEVIIIAQTALALAGDREKALEAGCNDYISKPVQKEELLKKLIRYLA